MTDYGTLLRDHVTIRCRSIDRIFLQAYVPRLQIAGEVCTFLRWQRKYPIPSSAALGKIGDAYVKAVYRFAEANHIPVVPFKKGEKKEETARPYLEIAAREGKDRVVLIGVAQEKASTWKSWPRRGQEKTGHPAHGVGPRDGLHKSLLILSLGFGMGRRVLENQRLRALSDLAMAQWARLGQTAAGESRYRL